MKIRNGFVSNSSSSSFCIYGIETTYEDLISILEIKGINVSKIKEELEYEGCIDNPNESFKDILDNSSLSIYHFGEEDMTFIGRSFGSLGEDETPREFKTEIRKDLSEKLGYEYADRAEFHEGTYYC